MIHRFLVDTHSILSKPCKCARRQRKRREALVCLRYQSSVCAPKCSLITAEIFDTYKRIEPSFMSFCPVDSRLSESIVDEECLRYSSLKN